MSELAQGILPLRPAAGERSRVILCNGEEAIVRGHLDLAEWARLMRGRELVGWPRHAWGRWVPIGDEGRPVLTIVTEGGRGAFPVTVADAWPADWLLNWSGGV